MAWIHLSLFVLHESRTCSETSSKKIKVKRIDFFAVGRAKVLKSLPAGRTGGSSKCGLGEKTVEATLRGGEMTFAAEPQHN